MWGLTSEWPLRSGAVSKCSLLFQHKVTFDPTSSYTLEDLKPDTLYHFQLAARSDLGVGVFTPTIEARTAQSSKCLPRPYLSQLGWGTPVTDIHPSPSSRWVVRSAESSIGLQSGLLSLDPEKGTGKCPASLCPGSGCLLCSLPSLLTLSYPW